MGVGGGGNVDVMCPKQRNEYEGKKIVLILLTKLTLICDVAIGKVHWKSSNHESYIGSEVNI